MKPSALEVMNNQNELLLDPTYAIIESEEMIIECDEEEPTDNCHEWHEHEHTSPSVQTQAGHLLDVAGSPELAKHAIDVAAQQSHEPQSFKE